MWFRCNDCQYGMSTYCISTNGNCSIRRRSNLPWDIVDIFGKIKKENIFIFILLGAFSFVLPVLNAFRNLAFNEVDLFETLKDITDNFSTMWLAGDYDAYTMLTLAIDHVSTNGVTWMRQLVGVALFWVPREIWKNKPVGSGYFIADNLGWAFKNLSCPLPGEAYINLGIVGVFFFAFIIGKIMKFLDSCYWYQNNKDDGQISVLYPVTMIMFFFMCRGIYFLQLHIWWPIL